MDPSSFQMSQEVAIEWKNIIMFSITLMLNQLRSGKQCSLEVILEMPPLIVF